VTLLPRLRLLVVLGSAAAAAAVAHAADSAHAADAVTFNEHIRPILAENCFACHGSDAAHRKANLRLDQGVDATALRDGIRAFAPGSLDNSEAWQRILSTEPDEVMPPPESHKSPLKPEQRALLQRWIEQGAVYQNHWAYEPVSRPALPAAAGGAKAADGPIDRFIGAKLAAKGLAFAPEASREVLLRRLTLDLTGLPPTPAELDAFLADRSPGAYDRAVTRLLASPRYGEHFARYWLDAVRYADTHGLHLDNLRTLWPYRDWVVRAFNANLPFDQFTIDQIAGDQLPAPTLDQLIATGYTRSHLTTAEAGAIEAEMEARSTADRRGAFDPVGTSEWPRDLGVEGDALPARLGRTRSSGTGHRGTIRSARLRALAGAHPHDRPATTGGLFQVLHEALHADERDTSLVASEPFTFSGADEREEAIKRALSYIHANYREPIVLADLLSVTSMSRSTFTRQFHVTAQTCYTDYLNRVRLKAVCQELASGQAPIGTIALNNGFTQISFFNRLFRREMGESLSSYRAKLRADSTPLMRRSRTDPPASASCSA